MVDSKQEHSDQGKEPEKQESKRHILHKGCRDCQKKEEKIADITDTLKRLQAEFENYQKRAAKENGEYKKYAVEGLMKKLLPILDSFDNALKHSSGSQDSKVQEGIRLLHTQLWDALKSDGLERMETLGKKFEHDKHDVMMTEQSDNPDTVLEELQSGYIFNGKVIRHAKVKIGVQKEDTEKSQEGENAGKQ